ncbi:hypothetical protein [Lachnospira eligens]|jgi:hypothetical protein|nr:hypothetical protein [Lachnospira eligens]
MGTVISIIILMFVIAIFIDNKKEEKNNAERNAEEFMKKHFGEDYKE